MIQYLGKKHSFTGGTLNDNTNLLAWAVKNIRVWPDKSKLLASCTGFAEGFCELEQFPSIIWTKTLDYEPSLGAYFGHFSQEYVASDYISDIPQAIAHYEWVRAKQSQQEN